MNMTAEISTAPPLSHIRMVAAAVTAAVVVDVIAVQAPFLAIVALPFLLTAAFLRRGHVPSLVAVVLVSLGFAAICANYVASGLDDVPWGDLVFLGVGGPASLALAGLSVVAITRRRH